MTYGPDTDPYTGYRLVHGIPTPGAPVRWEDDDGTPTHGHYIGRTKTEDGHLLYRVRETMTDTCWWAPEGDLFHDTPENG